MTPRLLGRRKYLRKEEEERIRLQIKEFLFSSVIVLLKYYDLER